MAPNLDPARVLDQIQRRMPSPVEALQSPLIRQKQLHVWIKRDDLIHPELSGNKWRKLKYNLLEAAERNAPRLLTFGGAFSNHIAALAAAGQILQWPTLGIIRGEAPTPLNPTLQKAVGEGMELKFVSRGDYRKKDDPAMIASWVDDLSSYYIIPEGGTNKLALKGVEELTEEVRHQLDVKPDYVLVSCGTGGTMAGLIQGFDAGHQIIGFPALKGDFLEREIRELLGEKKRPGWELCLDYHFGGYAKFQPELIQFINQFNLEHQLPLDPIYTGKLFYGFFDLVKKDFFPPGSHLLLIHTGGLQGIKGFNQRFGNLIHSE
jgi:1-aminocyclopropane-1-carboxylate deaminase